MAQTGYTPLQIYSSSTGGASPAAGNLANSTLGSELAINITDGKLFYKDNGGSVQVIAWKTTPTTAGGTGLTSYTAGDLLYYATGTALSKLAIGTAGNYLSSSGTAPQWSAPAALTKTDDTNVTLTLGGSASTALLNAASITVGWTGTLAVGRGGTGASTFTAGQVLFGNGTSALNTSANLFWDNANGRLGVNTSSPAYAADIRNGDLIVSRGTSAAADASIYFGSTTNNYIYSGNANNIMAFATNGSECQRIHASGGVSIGNTTDPGATNLSVTGTTKSARFFTDTGDTSAANNTATTIFTMPTLAQGLYLVQAALGNNAPATFTAVSLIRQGNGTSAATALSTATSMTISVTGLNIQATQTSGGTATISWSVTRFA